MRQCFLLALLLLTSACSAESLKGLDLLGLAKLNAPVIAREIDPNSAIGLLDVTFGDPRPNLTRLIQSGKVSAVRVHLGDGTPSNHQCRGNELSLSYMASQAKKWAAYSSKFATVQWYVNAWLEQGCTDRKLVDGWYAQIKKYWPAAIQVCSQWRGYCPSNTLKEIHGGGHGDITSNDGVSLFDSNSFDFVNSGKVLTLGWTNCMNGRVTGEKGTPPPPLQRKNWCTTNEIRQAVRIMRDPEWKPAMAGCIDINPPRISKTNAEYYGLGADDGRGNKPMLILPDKVSGFKILSPQGKQVGCFKYYGTYATPKLFRYYEGNCSGKTPDQLMDLIGGEWGKIVAGNKCYNWNSIRRLGVYR